MVSLFPYTLESDPHCLPSPDRWNNLPETAKHMPGVWGNLLTFLGGARSCIGYRFALVEYVILRTEPFPFS